MKIVCPECGFLGKIRDDEVPKPGQTIVCPRCSVNFTFEPEIDFSVQKESGGGTRADDGQKSPEAGPTEPPPADELESRDGAESPPATEGERLDEPEPSLQEVPQSPGKIEWDTDFGKERNRKISGGGGKKYGWGDFEVKRVALLSTAIFLALAAGFFLGRATKSTQPEVPTPPKTVKMDKPENPSPPKDLEDKEGKPTEDIDTVPLPPATEPDGGEETTVPGIDWDNYTSDEYFSILEIDRKVKEWRESNLSEVQLETDAKEYASTFKGKNLNGTLVIKEIRRRYFEGVDFPGMNDSFPDESYRYVIKAVSADPVSQSEHELCDVLIGMKGTEDTAGSLRKGGEIYVEGIIYSWKMSGGTYDIYLINSVVELID